MIYFNATSINTDIKDISVTDFAFKILKIWGSLARGAKTTIVSPIVLVAIWKIIIRLIFLQILDNHFRKIYDMVNMFKELYCNEEFHQQMGF